MKNILLITLFLFPFLLAGQELCNNALDDDFDGLIDLNDPDCDCEGLPGFTSLILNPSFDDTLFCPLATEMWAAEGWNDASFGSTCDFWHECVGYFGWGGMVIPEWPTIDGGLGYVGFFESAFSAHEMPGTCLTSPMLAGVSYQCDVYLAYAQGMTSINLSLYGTPNCGDLPWAGEDCPIGFGAWELLDNELMVLPVDGSWNKVTFTFTPATDIDAIAIGGPCGLVPTTSYYYIDGMHLAAADHFSEIIRTGDWCDGNLQLSTSIDTIGGSWQWFKNGIALIGETGETISVNSFGLGIYTAEYSVGGQCLRLAHSVYFADALDADFAFNNTCFGGIVDFENTSTIPEGGSPNWFWDFGDGTTSTDENPSHTYGASGIYNVKLIGINDLSCNDTTIYELTVFPLPDAKIEFIAGGISSEVGSTGGCIVNPVQFNDISSVPIPDDIISWLWNFGDGTTSTSENPIHTFGTVGTYTITLTVTSENGCSDITTNSITMTNGMVLDILANNPTCYGFSDGSVVVSVGDPVGEITFKISNQIGTILNIDNSNVANNLSTGWYYIDVEDDSECAGVDSVFLDQPDKLDIEINTKDPLCYGDNTGWAIVDTVYNASGLYSQITYLWNPNYVDNNGIGEDSTWLLTAGDYTLTINDENGCSEIINFIINQPDSLFLTEFGYEPAYCRLYNYQNGNGVVKGAVAGGTADYSYTWKNTDTGIESENTTWGGLNPGNYEFTVIDANGCIYSKSLFLDSLNPIADFNIISSQLNSDNKGTAPVEVIFENQSKNFANPNNPSADTTFFWNLNQPFAAWELSQNYFENYDTIYLATGKSYEAEVCLVAINKNGCTDTACKIITVFEPIVFTAVNIFTPNNDGKNDAFTFDFKSASINSFHCIIVNRWGETIAEINSINGFWDGTNQAGNLCSNGVYFYTYSALTDNGTKLSGQGTVELVGR